jgi:hypothetical protein
MARVRTKRSTLPDFAPGNLQTGAVPNALTIGRMFDLAVRLANTSGAMAAGLLGGSLGYVAGTVWTSRAGATVHLSPYELCAVGFVLFVSTYVLVAYRPYFCLERAHLMFVDNCITVGEYEKMRTKCLKINRLM